MYKDLSDYDLLLKLRECADSEKEQVFLELYERYKHLVIKICHYHTGDYDGSGDLMHDVFAKVIESAESIKHPELFRCWLMTTTRNLCIDHIRSSSHLEKKKIAAEGIEIMSDAQVEDRYIARMDRQKLRDQLASCIQKMDPRDINIFKLRWRGLRAGQISKLLHTDRQELRRSYDRIKYNLEACMKTRGLTISMDQIIRLGELDD